MNNIMVVVLTVLLAGCVDSYYPYQGTPQAYVYTYTNGNAYNYSPAQCYDKGSGGHADCDEIASRPAREWAIKTGQTYQQPYSTSLYPQPQIQYYGNSGYVPVQSQNIVLESGMCEDKRSGWKISCQFLADNPRYECCGILEQGANRKSTYSSRGGPTPTVSNYLSPGMVPSRCQSRNHEIAGKCLLDRVGPLIEFQAGCLAEKDPSMRHPDCEKRPGEKAEQYYKLGRILIANP